MPPKGRTSNGCSEDLVEALLDPRIIEQLGDALGGRIGSIVEAKLEIKLQALLGDFQKLKNENAENARKCAGLEVKVKCLGDENIALRSRLDEMEAYSRGENLIIYGLKESSYAEVTSARSTEGITRGGAGPRGTRGEIRGTVGDGVSVGGEPIVGGGSLVADSGAAGLLETSHSSEEAVLKLCNNVLGIDVSKHDISVAHRIVRRGRDTTTETRPSTPAPLIVRFTNRRTRNAVFAARKSLASKMPGVYINEHLLPTRAALLKEARQLVKNKKLEGAWSSNGCVYVKIANLPNSRPVKVNDLKDLPRG